MKKILVVTLGLFSAFSLASCGKRKENKYGYEGKGAIKESITYQLRTGAMGKISLVPYTKVDSIIDEKGNILFEYDYYKYEDEDWDLGYKTEYKYDNDGNKISEETFRLSSADGQFKIYNKTEYTYEEGKLKTVTYYMTKTFDINYTKESVDTYTYDSDGCLVMTLKIYTDEFKAYQDYNNNNYKVEYGYDNKSLKTIDHSVEDEDGWRPTVKEVFTRDAKDRVEVEERFYYRDDETGFEKSSKTEYTYNSKGNNSEILHYEPTDDGSDWKLEQKAEYTYNSKNKETKMVVYYFKGEWLKTGEVRHEYNKNGDETLYAEYRQRDNGLLLARKTETTYTYYK